MSRSPTAQKKRLNAKRKSGRKSVALLLQGSQCYKCRDGIIAPRTIAIDTKRGTKWVGMCDYHFAAHRKKHPIQ